MLAKSCVKFSLRRKVGRVFARWERMTPFVYPALGRLLPPFFSHLSTPCRTLTALFQDKRLSFLSCLLPDEGLTGARCSIISFRSDQC